MSVDDIKVLIEDESALRNKAACKRDHVKSPGNRERYADLVRHYDRVIYALERLRELVCKYYDREQDVCTALSCTGLDCDEKLPCE